MQTGERGAERRAMKGLDAARPHAGEKGHHCRRAAAQLAQGDAVATGQRYRAGNPVLCEMLHQRDEERQILPCNPFFVKRQNEIAALGGDQKVRVLDPLGDPLAGQHLANVVERGKGSELVVGDIGIDGHQALLRSPRPSRLVRRAGLEYSRGATHRPPNRADASKGDDREDRMSEPIPAQKEPYGITVEAGKRYFWCACGRSASQPFCDGSHKDTGLTPVPFTAETTEEVWLCGCKATGGKPYCDGTHNSL